MSNPSRTLATPLAPAGSSLSYSVINLQSEVVAPPIARAIPRVEVVHGETRVDPYYWMREKSNPEVIAYLDAENRHTDSVMRHTEDLQERLYQEMRARIKEADLSVPERLDDYLYYSRTETGGQYPIVCRKQGSAEAGEEVLLDQNSLASSHTYFKIGAVEVSPDHRFLAYSVDTSGAEDFTVYIKDLRTGTLLPESINGASSRVAWAN